MSRVIAYIIKKEKKDAAFIFRRCRVCGSSTVVEAEREAEADAEAEEQWKDGETEALQEATEQPLLLNEGTRI